MKTEDLHGTALETWTPEEVKAGIDESRIVLIDVRTPYEYGFEHIPGALLFPMSSFEASALPDQGSKRLVFHCGSGIRSHAIAERCASAGIQPLAHMEGGLAGWKAAKLPYMAINPTTGAMSVKQN
ncbi:MAG: rhodanese-like domain-containing protein [Yoonia sp.]